MSLTDEQIAARRRSIGSTDSAAIIGYYRPELAHLSKMKNATDVWLRLAHNIDLPRNSAMGRGIRVEPLLRDLYRQTVGPVDDPPGTLRHPRHAWMVGSPDGLSVGELVEFKSVNAFIRHTWGEPGSDAIPVGYHCQIQHLLEVTGRTVAHVLAAFGRDYKEDDGTPAFAVEETAVYLIHKDEALVAEIVSCGSRFMTEFVDRCLCPPIKPLHNIRRWAALTKEASDAVSI